MDNFVVSDGVDGTYVGYGVDEERVTRPLLWSGGVVTEIDSPDDADAATAGINRHGVVVANDVYNYRPYIWRDGEVELLALPAGATSGYAAAIDDAGVIVGRATIDGVGHGMVWAAQAPGTYQDLGVGDGSLSFVDIDNSGSILASTTNADDFRRALKGKLGKEFHPLPGLDSTEESSASTVNGPYVIGVGTLPGADGSADLVWKGNSPKPVTGIHATDVNRQGLMSGGTTKVFNTLPTPQAAVSDGKTVTILPNHVPTGVSNASGITEDGTVIGTSNRVDGLYGGNLPVTWTCS